MEEVYAALLLHKLGKPVDEHTVTTVIKATGAHVDESKIKSLVASLKDIDIDKELESAMAMSAAPAVSSGGVREEKKEEAPKEEKREAAAEGLSALFG